MRAGLPLEIANSENVQIKGVKTVLFGILRAAEGPLTSAQIWELAEVSALHGAVVHDCMNVRISSPAG